MNWINVKDQLPNRYTEVMIYPRPYNSFTGEFGLLKGSEEPVWYYQVYENGWGWEDVKIEVTHWMPIPADPEDS